MNGIILETMMLWTTCVCISLLMIEKVISRVIAIQVRPFNLEDVSLFGQYTGSNVINDLRVPIISSVLPLIVLAIFFILGQKLHTNVKEISDVIYQTEWNHYPSSVQRFLLFMLHRSQKPFYLSAYGIMTLKLENFVQVSEWQAGSKTRYVARKTESEWIDIASTKLHMF